MALAFSPYDVLQAFSDRARHPSPAELSVLLRAGVPASAIQADPDGDGYGLAVATVERLGDGRFDFVEHEGEAALIVVARNGFGDPADLVAFQRRSAWLAPYIGAVAVLGAQEILAPRIGEALTVHRTGFAWLRSGREGVVPVDERLAAIQLRDWGPFRAAEVDHGLHLQKLFEVALPRIVVPVPADARLAA